MYNQILLAFVKNALIDVLIVRLMQNIASLAHLDRFRERIRQIVLVQKDILMMSLNRLVKFAIKNVNNVQVQRLIA